MLRRRSNIDAALARERTYYRANKARERARAIAWRKEHPERYKIQCIEQNLKRYGITLKAYESLLGRQSGRCAICRTDKPGRRNTLFYVDHDHKTGLLRGLLCHKCNSGIGLFNDDLELLRGAVAFLEEHQPKLELA